MKQHAKKWSEYQNLPHVNKQTYFDLVVPYTKTVCAYLDQCDEQIWKQIWGPIVENVTNWTLAEMGEDYKN